MDKYVVISDISKYPSYKNINARLVYLHVACHLDTRTYTYYHSIRSLAEDLDLSVSAVRHALKQLLSDGLLTAKIAVPTTTHYATHKRTQPTTHLHLVTIKDLCASNDTPNDTSNDTPNDTPINKINKKKQKNRLSDQERKTKFYRSGEMGVSIVDDLFAMMQGD